MSLRRSAMLDANWEDLLSQPMTSPNDRVEIESPLPFAATVATLSAAFEKAGLKIFATIDHAAGAAEVGLTMPPTVVLIYGSPKGGTPVMQMAPATALDLPLRLVVREERGRVLVAYHPVAAVLGAAGVPPELAGRLEGAQRLIAAALTGVAAEPKL